MNLVGLGAFCNYKIVCSVDALVPCPSNSALKSARRTADFFFSFHLFLVLTVRPSSTLHFPPSNRAKLEISYQNNCIGIAAAGPDPVAPSRRLACSRSLPNVAFKSRLRLLMRMRFPFGFAGRSIRPRRLRNIFSR